MLLFVERNYIPKINSKQKFLKRVEFDLNWLRVDLKSRVHIHQTDVNIIIMDPLSRLYFQQSPENCTSFNNSLIVNH